MVVVQPELKDIAGGMEAWDAEVNEDIAILRDGPTPTHYQAEGLDETDLAATYPPGSFYNCIVFVNHSVFGWWPYFSNGTTWEEMARMADEVTQLVDATGGTISDSIPAIPSPADSPIDADALRDDLDANTLPPIRDGIASNAAKVNEIILALQAAGIMA